ncbi:IS3 family transposase, partial [Shigella sonnei]|uniref:IS3 family transposase n=1 Tax=Shigella sonnei TaxID=624 RepID=UPI002093593B
WQVSHHHESTIFYSSEASDLYKKQVIREYIEIFYNRQRRHSRLGNISPAAFREKYHQMAA